MIPTEEKIVAQDETEEYETMQKEAAEKGERSESPDKHRVRFHKPHCTAVSPPPPSLPPSSTEEHDHMQPSAHMGAHVGELVLVQCADTLWGGGGTPNSLDDSLVDIVFTMPFGIPSVNTMYINITVGDFKKGLKLILHLKIRFV